MRSSIGGTQNGSWRAALDSSSGITHQQQQQQQLASITTGQLVQGTNGDIYIMVTPNSAISSASGSTTNCTLTVSGSALSSLAAASSVSAATGSVDARSYQQQLSSSSALHGVKRPYVKQQQNFLLDSEHRGLGYHSSSGSNSNSNSSSNLQNGGPVIASVVGNSNGAGAGSRSNGLSACCDREKRRKSSHNEVERRRRDKINNLINQLAEMMPAQEWSSHAAGAGTSAAAAAAGDCSSPAGAADLEQEQEQELQLQQQHQQQQQQQQPWLCLPKSVVLKKAVDYFGQLREQNSGLINESQQLLARVQGLENQVDLLERENARLRELLNGSAD